MGNFVYSIFIGAKECKNTNLNNRGIILEDIFHRGTHQSRFHWGIKNKGVLSFWFSQMLNTKKLLQGDNFAN